MKRFVLVFLITIVLGIGLYFVGMLFVSHEDDYSYENEEEAELYIDIYELEISLASLMSMVEEGQTVVVFMGNKNDETTQKVGEVISGIAGIEDLNIYYLEKEENETYQELMNEYPLVSDYIKFSPVILVFKDNDFVGGLPGEVKEKNIINFFSYTEVM